MKASDKCLDLIETHEGFSAKPYQCPAGRWTIGFGSTYYEDGRRVSPGDPPVTKERARALMRTTLVGYEAEVNSMLKRQITQGQFDALVDFAYNAGGTNLRNSTLMRKFLAGDVAGAAAEFDKWVMGGGKRLPGLVRRRAAERALFEGKA